MNNSFHRGAVKSAFLGPVGDLFGRAWETAKGVPEALSTGWGALTGNTDGPEADRVQALIAGRNKAKAMEQLQGILLAGLGTGIAARGGVGLYNLMARNARPKRKDDPQLFSLPEKTANWFSDWMSGGSARSPGDIPYYKPLAVLGAGAGLYGGYKGLDMVLDRLRKRDRKQEVDQARQEFQAALTDTYGRKESALDRAFDKAAEAIEKRAFGDVTGALTGDYLTYAALASLLAGTAGYSMAHNRSKQVMLEKALRARERARNQAQPAPLFISQPPGDDVIDAQAMPALTA